MSLLARKVLRRVMGSSSEVLENRRTVRRFLILLLCGYVVYVYAFWLSTGWEHLLRFSDWRGFQRAFVLIGPVYLSILWFNRRYILGLDRHAVYCGFAAWLLTYFLQADVSKGLMNALVIEPPLVGLLYGVVLTRFAFVRRLSPVQQRRVAFALTGVYIIGSAFVAFAVPAVRD